MEGQNPGTTLSHALIHAVIHALIHAVIHAASPPQLPCPIFVVISLLHPFNGRCQRLSTLQDLDSAVEPAKPDEARRKAEITVVEREVPHGA